MDRLILATVVLSMAWLAAPARACAPAMPPGAFVSIAAEEALVVWDQANGIEHLIRRADFHTDAEDFGFLVPTPSPPELSEVDGDVFDRLRTHITPPTEYRGGDWEPMTCCMMPLFLVMAGDGAPIEVAAVDSVQVLSTARVAGMDATVVRADEAEALGAWLGERGYENRPALVEWLAPYVEEGFAITAFRFEKSDENVQAIGSQAVRMSFETDRPFYPYREPSDHPEELGRSLRVHVVSAERAVARLGVQGDWSAGLEYAAPLDDAGTLLGDSLGEPSGELWLTSYLDTVSTRADADLRFMVREGEEYRPEPVIMRGSTRTLPIPIEPILLLGGGIWWWRRRRAKAT